MIYVELAIVASLIVANGLLAMAEFAVVSSRRARLQTMVKSGIHGSRRALALSSDPGRFLSTVQIGITLVGILSGAFSGATLGIRLGEWLHQLGLSIELADTIGVGVVVVAITYLSLIVGELVPKQIALRDPERVAARVAPPMALMARIASPLVWFLDVSGRLLLRTLGQNPQAVRSVTDDEIRTVVAEAESAGVIEPGEREMIAGVMRLGDRSIRAVMTPRRAVDMIDLLDNPEDIRRKLLQSGHSRLPVYERSPDEIIGVVQAKDLLDAFLRNEEIDLKSRVRAVPIVPDTADAIDLIDVIENSPIHLVLVADEYGHFEGLVTNADILEAIVGASLAGIGESEPELVRRADGSLLISGAMAADELAESLGIALENDRAYETAAGFILDRAGHLPVVGETLDDQGWHFEVLDLDGRRIDKILASRKPAPAAR
jgi:putative hemolysin